jgi:hypothetical protein
LKVLQCMLLHFLVLNLLCCSWNWVQIHLNSFCSFSNSNFKIRKNNSFLCFAPGSNPLRPAFPSPTQPTPPHLYAPNLNQTRGLTTSQPGAPAKQSRTWPRHDPGVTYCCHRSSLPSYLCTRAQTRRSFWTHFPRPCGTLQRKWRRRHEARTESDVSKITQRTHIWGRFLYGISWKKESHTPTNPWAYKRRTPLPFSSFPSSKSQPLLSIHHRAIVITRELHRPSDNPCQALPPPLDMKLELEDPRCHLTIAHTPPLDVELRGLFGENHLTPHSVFIYTPSRTEHRRHHAALVSELANGTTAFLPRVNNASWTAPPPSFSWWTPKIRN